MRMSGGVMWIAVLLAMAVCAGAETGARKPVRKAPPALSVQRRIDTLLGTKAARNAQWGIHVVSLKTGRVVYERNAGEHFAPASNAKLFTTALALSRLGKDYRFATTVRADQNPDAAGRIEGDLRLVGGADPTFSGRAYPYRKDDDAPNPLEPVELLCNAILDRGVRVISGDIVGDDRLFPYDPYPEGWTVDDSTWEYGAPVSALVFSDNAFTLVVRPAREVGGPARVMLSPPALPLVIDNQVTTVGDGDVSDVQVNRLAGSREVRITGKLRLQSKGVRQLLAVDDPALYAAYVLHDELTRRGVRIDGVPVARHRWSAEEPFGPNEGVELARRESPPLSEVAQVVDKVSQNLHAEILLREVARVRRKDATREAGLKEMKQFLDEIGVPPDACHFEDGSGLSRRTLVTPAAITRLLVYMDSREHDGWDRMLPVGGEDGTLESRFEEARLASAIHAKTGTLSTASALSGYITTGRKARLAFSIIANGYTLPSSEVRRVIDRIGLALIDWEGN
ncbi:MAG: D-alanyl-D-alanine carboxypeptidase/D-alanyl-D-alanine-endopeptidase [Bryobacterales bacterium]|nr:D-alanyl-D-alanine carboxypeptidase/D-alanyl-D-alanine-endopeptidase [Bryobacterales bacterium]